MRLENQNCKCECSKIVAEIFRDRLNSIKELSPKRDSLVPRELRFSSPGTVAGPTKHHEDLKKSIRKHSVVDSGLPNESRPNGSESQPRAWSREATNERQSSCDFSCAQSLDHNKPFSLSDSANVKLYQQTRNLKCKRKRTGLKRKQVVKYSKGLYPGTVIGHVNCVDSPVFVPKNMGWLWNITDEVTGRKPHPDWIPGAVPKYLKKMIKHFALELDGEQIENPLATAPSKKKLAKSKTAPLDGQQITIEECDTQPTLHLHTKKGVYYVKVLPSENDDYRKEPMIFQIGQDDKTVSSSDSSLEVELIRPHVNAKHNCQTSLHESMEYHELPEEIQTPKSKKHKITPKKVK